eukprot:359877-Chlamydomonas_euryale.AAC.3
MGPCLRRPVLLPWDPACAALCSSHETLPTPPCATPMGLCLPRPVLLPWDPVCPALWLLSRRC